MYRRLILIFLILNLSSRAQEGLNKEELFKLLQEHPADSVKTDIYNELVWPVYSSDFPDSSLFYGEKAITLATKLNDKKRLSIAHRRLGITYINLGQTQKAIEHQEISYRLSEEIGYKRGMMLALNNIGVAYLNNELLYTSLGYFLRSLRIIEEIGDYSSASSIYSNCGMIYRRTGDLEKSKEFFFKALDHAEQEKEPEMLVMANCNVSTAYRLLAKRDSAWQYLRIAESHLNSETSNNTRFRYFLTRALLRVEQGMHEQALQDFLSMRELVSVLSDEITLLINIAEAYLNTGDRGKAVDYFVRAYNLSEQNRLFNNLEHVSLALANVYESTGDMRKFAFYIRKHLAYRDSSAQVTRIQQLQRQQLEYDYRRRHIADSISFLQKEQLNNLELAAAEGKLLRARNTRALLITLMVILAGVAVFVLNRFIVVRRQKGIIETQKALVETKNEEILDSINYARRLQAAILPQLEDIRKYLDAAVLFLPKDIIGGDFYFFEKHKNRIYFAVCDCTGHGIPGALMSVVCYEALEKAIRTFRLRQPGQILDKARELIIENLNASDQNIKDGMDCSLLMIDQLKQTVQWAGANNDIWLVKDGNITEIKADKQPVAHYEHVSPFTTHELQIEPGTCVYISTDGYSDQFGGPGAKKYKTKTLKKFITAMCDRPPAEQVELLRENFSQWKKELDQVDDVAVAVIRF